MKKRSVKIGILIIVVITAAGFSSALYGKGQKKYYDLFVKTGDSWKMINKELIVTRDFHSDNLQVLPGKYFHGARLTQDLEGRKPGPVVLHVNYPSSGEFVFFLETVSDTGIVTISLDKKKLKTFTFLTGPEHQGPWVASRFLGRIYQCDYNMEYSVKIPAGKHDITIQNMGTDWLSIGHFVFTNYSEKILDPEYEEWKTYKANLKTVGQRLADYTRRAEEFAALQPGTVNGDVIPTMKLQLENFERLVKNHGSIDFNLMRTENELKELFEYLDTGKSYFKEKRGRIKIGYVSEIDSTLQPYDVVVPRHYAPFRKYALVLSLHGYQNEIQKYSILAKEEKNPIGDSLQCIIAGVYGRRNHYYSGAAEEDVLTVMKEVQSRYSIDTDKIYLTGSSMGGYGTWFIGLNYPDRFAAISPVCGPTQFSGAKMLNTISPVEYISNALHLPARIYHGAIDSTVNVNNSRTMVQKLKEMKYEYVYNEYPDVGHDSWNKADADSSRLPWLLQHSRQLYPMTVSHRAFYLRYGKAYWLQITGKKTWKQYAEIRGEVTGKNEIIIHTDNISSFSIDLKHPALKFGEPIRLVVDGDSILLHTSAKVMEFHSSKDSGWAVGGAPGNHLSKKLGMEGPGVALETRRFLLVYGTGKPDSIGLSKKIGELLQKGLLGSDMEIKLVPDTMILAGTLDENYNLYLIGSPDENKYLREILPGLPIIFHKDSLVLDGTYSRMETGVQLIYPNPRHTEHYVIVDVYPGFIPVVRQLMTYPVADYFIYSLKGGKFELLKDEYFGPDWQVVH